MVFTFPCPKSSSLSKTSHWTRMSAIFKVIRLTILSITSTCRVHVELSGFVICCVVEMTSLRQDDKDFDMCSWVTRVHPLSCYFKITWMNFRYQPFEISDRKPNKFSLKVRTFRRESISLACFSLKMILS